MTDLRQAAQQALEALEHCCFSDALVTDKDVAADAIYTLRTALEQQAEPVAWDVFELRLYGAPQEKQHRVLWVDRYTQPDGSTPDLDTLLEAAKTEGGIDGRAKTLHVRPLYTTPPQRQWVGLEAEEILDLFDRNNVYGSKWVEFARTVEAKLKEKNSD